MKVRDNNTGATAGNGEYAEPEAINLHHDPDHRLQFPRWPNASLVECLCGWHGYSATEFLAHRDRERRR